jgi:hypothetical protein
MPDNVIITIVVNGQPTQIEANPNASVQSLIDPALRQTGNAGQPPENWELRDGQGHEVSHQDKVESFVGQTLFLNLRAGIGG